MTRPLDIPQDVWDAALEVFETYLYNGESAQEIIARAILSAKAEEREACAQLIEQHDLWFSFEPAVTTGGMGAVAPHATPAVAAAIRKRGEG